jgi:hypothetical protein
MRTITAKGVSRYPITAKKMLSIGRIAITRLTTATTMARMRNSGVALTRSPSKNFGLCCANAVAPGLCGCEGRGGKGGGMLLIVIAPFHVMTAQLLFDRGIPLHRRPILLENLSIG